MVKNILLVGVGGQGTILVSRILSEGLVMEGYDVKMSEIHGMAQRGGSVTTQIRYGNRVYSPSITPGEVDVLVAFEKLEGARYVNQLRKDGTLIINEEEMYPLPVLVGTEKYPEGLLEEIKEKVENTISLNARRLAEDLGEPRVQNIIMLGMLITALELGEIDWISLIKANLPERVHEVNIKAFELGTSLLGAANN
jgi:indolepyruvate ferredoxin oxidoreductase beta subunit